MKRLACGILLCAALGVGVTGCGGSTPTIKGNFAGFVSGQASGPLVGVWTLSFTSKGTLIIRQGGTVVVTSHLSYSDHEVTFAHETGPDACPGSGTYAWAVMRKTLRFALVKDSCAPRKTVLLSGFSQVGKLPF